MPAVFPASLAGKCRERARERELNRPVPHQYSYRVESRQADDTDRRLLLRAHSSRPKHACVNAALSLSARQVYSRAFESHRWNKCCLVMIS